MINVQHLKFAFILAYAAEAFSPQLRAADNGSTYSYNKILAGHALAITIQVGPFDATAHQVKHVSVDAGYRIDDQIPIGNDGATTATTEFKRLDITWDGKKVSLPRSAWSAIFNVPLRRIAPDENTTGFAIVPSDDGSAVLLIFKTGLAEVGPEEAWLVVTENGTWKRFDSRRAED